LFTTNTDFIAVFCHHIDSELTDTKSTMSIKWGMSSTLKGLPLSTLLNFLLKKNIIKEEKDTGYLQIHTWVQYIKKEQGHKRLLKPAHILGTFARSMNGSFYQKGFILN
jgi:hypothetical protein